MKCVYRSALTLMALSVGVVAMIGGCGEKGDVPPPRLTQGSTPPTADVAAFDGKVEVTGVELSSDGHNVIVKGKATQDMGVAPLAIKVDCLDSAGGSLGAQDAVLVLDPMPEDPRPRITAGSNVFVNVSIQLLKQPPAKLVLKPAGQ